MLALYVVFASPSATPAGDLGQLMWIVLIAVGLIAGVLFNPLRRGIGRWVDRTFFKISHSHGQALRVLREDLSHTGSPTELIGILDRFFATTLGLRAHAVAVRRGMSGGGRQLGAGAYRDRLGRLCDVDARAHGYPHRGSQPHEPRRARAAGYPPRSPPTASCCCNRCAPNRIAPVSSCWGEGDERRFIETDIALISSARRKRHGRSSASALYKQWRKRPGAAAPG